MCFFTFATFLEQPLLQHLPIFDFTTRSQRQGWGSGQNSGLRIQRPRSARLCDVKYIILPLSLQKWGLKCPEEDLNKAHKFSCRYRCTSQTLQVQFQTVAINQNAARKQVAFFFFFWLPRTHESYVYTILLSLGFPGGGEIKNPPASTGDVGSIPGSGRSPGG